MQNQTTDIRYGLYARKSSISEDKQMQSIESQIDELKEVATKQGLKILKTYTDQASAHKPNNRPKFAELMTDIENGHIDGILCWKGDRLARNPIDGGVIIYALQNSKIKIIKTPFNQYRPTDNTIPLTIELGMANQYSLDLSKNVKRGNKTKTKDGGWCGVAPAGYLNDKAEKTIIPDPERFEMVKKMLKLYKTGSYSLSSLSKVVNDDWKFRTYKRKNQGGKPLSKSSLYAILTNTFYYGFMQYGNNSNWGKHTPMITQAEFEQIQIVLRRQGQKGKIGHTTYDFPFIGTIKCGECESHISAQEKVKYACPDCRLQLNLKSEHECRRCGYKITKEVIANGNYYQYYHCTKQKKLADGSQCKQYSIKSDDLTNQFQVFVDRYQIHPKFEKWALKWLKHANKQDFKEKNKQNKAFERDYKDLEVKLQNLMDMRLSGELSPEEFFTHKQRLQKERDEAKYRLNKAESNQSDWIEEAEDRFDFMNGLLKRFEEGGTTEKKYIFRKLGQNFILKDGKLTLEVKKPYLIIKQLEKESDLSLEPNSSQSGSGNSPPEDEKCFAWQAR